MKKLFLILCLTMITSKAFDALLTPAYRVDHRYVLHILGKLLNEKNPIDLTDRVYVERMRRDDNQIPQYVVALDLRNLNIINIDEKFFKALSGLIPFLETLLLDDGALRDAAIPYRYLNHLKTLKIGDYDFNFTPDTAFDISKYC